MSYGVRLDTDMDIMEETRLKKKHTDLLTRLSKKLHFSYLELECLLIIYYKTQKDGMERATAMSRMQFQDVLHSTLDMTQYKLMDKIISALDKGTGQTVSMETWFNAMSLFLRGTLEEKIEYCFSVYDSHGDGSIGRDNMFELLRSSVMKAGYAEDVDEVKDLVDIIIKKMDVDRDGKVSFEDYRQTVIEKPDMMEALGPCLPDRLCAHAFLTTFTNNVGKV